METADMFKIVILVFLILLLVFVTYVATRPANFHYERSGVIKASAETIFPYLVDFNKGSEWSPYEKVDPNMKKTFSGEMGQVGSKMVFEGKPDAGSGIVEILKIEPNKKVDLKLTMTKPFEAVNQVEYILTPEADGETRFTWVMSGTSGFIGKMINVFIDCEKMVGDQFSSGIENLKAVIENKK